MSNVRVREDDVGRTERLQEYREGQHEPSSPSGIMDASSPPESRPRDVASQIENYQARKGSFSLTMLLPRDDQSSSSIQEFPR